MQELANEHCLTCFQSKNQSLLRIQSEETRGIEGALSKHFWFTKDDFRQTHICLPCWKQVDSFHRFHETVEKLYERGSSGEMSPSKVLVKSEPQNEEAFDFLDENDDSMTEGIKQEPEAYSWDETMDGQEDIIADVVKEEASAWAVEMNAGSDSEQSDTENELKDLEVAMQNNPRTKTKEERWKEDEYIREHVKYTCEQCGTTSSTFTMFLKHASEAHGNKKAFVVCCGNRFYKKIRLYQHVQWVNNPETFRCEACKRNYGNAEGIRRHMKEYHATEEEKKFKCDRCDQSFARQYKFKLHVQDHINWENQNLKCEHCNKTYKSVHILNNHIKLYHTQPTTFICDICAKGFHLKSHFIKHKMEHDAPDQLKMQCTICSRWLKNRENWRRHMQMHRGTEMKCPHCGHMSPHARALKGHIRRQHNEQKPIHSCQFCSKTFVQLISLKEHIAAIHVDDALYNCPFCSKSFNSSSNMHTHKKRMHPNEWLEEHNNYRTTMTILISRKRPLAMMTLAAILLVCVVTLAAAQSSSQLTCPGKTTCRECIQTSNCRWCTQANFTKPRCHGHDIGYCPEEYTVDPSNEAITLIARELSKPTKVGGGGAGGGYEAEMSGSSHWSSSSSSHSSSSSSSSSSGHMSASGHNIVQIYPQRVQLKLRLNEVYRLGVKYSQAEDYPVDLYYLMDLSKSMEDDKEKLSSLGAQLAEEMQKITSNFRLGFGSFVDKVLMPYVSTVPKKLEHPCDGCEAPYGYKNHMSLSVDTSRFSEEVERAAVSGNLDAPEGGFDAIMQAVVCREQIGWREMARRLLVFSTDAGFHYAGDGKLGGVITPNDGECHLDKTGRYTHSTIHDYPSISQINLKVKQNAINVIFAVTQNELSVYERLSKLVEGSSAAMLSNDSSNIVSLVRDEYNKISSSVEMKDNRTDSLIDVKYYSRCKGDGPLVQTSKCDGLKVGDIVNFEAHITLLKCPENPRDWNQILQIYPIGINESLTVDIEMLCSCPCELPGNPDYKEYAEECSGVGTYKCGICDCDEFHHGHKCECSATDIHTESGFAENCRQTNTSIECSGRGQCVCGVCDCDKRVNPEEIISGTFCECDNFSCDRNNGLLCSGPKQGVCSCGECVCAEGWTGAACDCKATNESCIPPSGGEICSGHGTCECGSCRCKITEEGRYSGRFCEKCPTCSGRCNEFKHCVQCQMYKTGPLADPDDCATNCTLFVPTGVKKVEIDEEKDDNKCTFFDEDDCRYEFFYNDSGEKIVVKAQEERECPPKVFMLGIVLAVIAAVVLIGLAVLLLWKLLTTIHDRREFARFEKERMMAKWDTGENPIYKQATTTFKNPTYAGK